MPGRRILVLVLCVAFLTLPLAGCVQSDDAPRAAHPAPRSGGGSPDPDASPSEGDATGTGGGGFKAVPPGSPKPPAQPAHDEDADAGDDGGDGPAAPGPTLTVTHDVAEERLLITVSGVDGDIRYGNLGVLVDGAAHAFGAHVDAASRTYAVDGASAEDARVEANHVLRVAASGDVHVRVYLRNAGRTLASFDANVPDGSGPASPDPVAPADGTAESGDEVRFAWVHATDPGDVRYEVQFDYDEQFSGVPGGVDGLEGNTLTIPSAWLPSVRVSGEPEPALWWRVRAVDAEGNVGSWSTAWHVRNASLALDVDEPDLPDLPDLPDADDALPAEAEDARPALALDAGATTGGAFLRVLDAAATLTPDALTVRAGDASYRFGARANPEAGTFTVEPVRGEGEPIQVGDRIIVPVTGRVDLAVVDLADGTVLAELPVDAPDATPPEPPVPLGPVSGALTGGGLATLAWAAAADAGGVTYNVVLSSDAGFAYERIRAAYGLAETSVDVALDAIPDAKDATRVHWAVQAVDEAGNESPWAFGVLETV